MGRWRSWFRALDSRSSWDSPGVADEAGAFLDGHLVESMKSAGTTVPPWMWLNAVAHGDQERLAWLASDLGGAAVGGSGAAGGSGWRWARARLAAELLSAGNGDAAVVAALQRDVLVPLELSLSHSEDLSPGALVDIVVAELACSR